MQSKIKDRVIKEADYIINTKSTVRKASFFFNTSKSTIHKDMHERLMEIDKERYKQVNDIFSYHLAIRHLNGGEATKNKYLKRSGKNEKIRNTHLYF